MGKNGGNAFSAVDSRVNSGSVHLRRLKLLGTASAVASAFVLAGTASAQAGPTVPAQCTVDPAPVATGSTITCVSTALITTPVSSSAGDGVEDLTVVIGSAEQPSFILTPGSTAISLAGGGTQTLNVINSLSTVTGSVDGVYMAAPFGPFERAITIVSEGSIAGFENGIYTTNDGSGLTSITTADVLGFVDNGIYARTGTFNGDGVAIDTTAGTVDGAYSGITVNNRGSGDVIITTADVVAQGADYYYGEGEGSAYLGGTGIEVSNGSGSGSVIIDTTAGEVDAYGDGIYVYNQSTSEVRITTADVSSGDVGIHVHASRYTLSIDGETRYYTETGAITIDTTAGTVGALDDGIEVYAVNTGPISITTATVGSTYGDGISVDTYLEDVTSTPAGLTINSTAGIVSGQDDGIDVYGESGGDITITTSSVIGRDDNGIEVDNFAATGATTINTVAGSVTGTYSGIQVNSYSDNGVSITTATVNAIGRYVSYGEGESSYRRGNAAIEVRNGSESGDLVIDTTAGSLSGISAGIDVSDGGQGDVTITTADVTGIQGDGIRINAGEGKFFSGESGGDITVNTVAGTVTGTDDGIDVDLNDASNLFLTTGDVEGGNVGIDVNAGGRRIIWLAAIDEEAPTEEPVMETGGNVTINTVAGSVTGGEAGIAVYNRGDGDVSITTADVTANGTGINVLASYRGFGPTVFVSGEGEALPDYDMVIEYGGDITINSVAGTVEGGNIGIAVYNSASGDVSITTADVTGGEVGIQVSMGEDRGMDRISTLDIDYYYGPGYGSVSGDVTIDTTAGSVTGGEHGIRVGNLGLGNVSITTADVTATGIEETSSYGEATYTYIEDGIGIEVRNFGGDVVIDTVAGSVSGYDEGILVNQYGSGSVSITTADVTSASSVGIMVDTPPFGESGAGSQEIVIDSTAGTVSGGEAGIRVLAGGGQAVSVTTADVAGLVGISITALRGYSGWVSMVDEEMEDAPDGDITVDSTAGAVSGLFAGITVTNGTTGDVNITTADVEGAILHGIQADNASSGSGELTIDSSAGAVTSGYYGINAESGSLAGGIDITTADVTGGQIGIIARIEPGDSYYGYPGLFVGEGESGEYETPVQTGAITINSTAGAVSGAVAGIVAHNAGTGAISITTADVTATGVVEEEPEEDAPTLLAMIGTPLAPEGTAIYATNTANSTGGITIDSTAGDVSGVSFGILANDFGSGGTVIRAGNVSSSAGVGVSSYSAQGTIAVSVAAGALVTSEVSAGVSVSTASLDGAVAISGGGSISGVFTGLDVNTSRSPITVTGLASVSASDGAGMILNTGGGGDITVTDVGAITGTGTTSMVLNAFGESISVQSSGLGGGITSDTAAGIELLTITTEGNSISLGGTSALGTVSGGTFGIHVQNGGYGPISIGAANVTGLGDSGIEVANTSELGGAITIGSTGTVRGVGNGILATNSGAAAPVSIAVNNVTATGTGSIGISASALGNVSVGSTGLVSAGLLGIQAFSSGGTTTVTANNVTATQALSTGIDASGLGAVSATSSGLVSAASVGITAESAEGPVTVAANNVTVTAAGSRGIVATGPVAVSVTSTGLVTAVGTGILASSEAGAVSVVANNTSASVAIAASGSGSVSVRSNGLASATSNAIQAVSTAGPVTIVANNATSSGATAVFGTVNGGAGNLAITTTGTVRGATSGVTLANTGTGSSMLTNSGSLSASSGPAVQATGRGVTINNSGTITGFVSLTANNDTFNNSGRFVVTANSDFGGGSDVFNNTGTVVVPAVLLASATAAVETTNTQFQFTLGGLEAFANSGSIDLRNGRVGDRLVIPGTYAGSGSASLALDLILGPNLLASDVLVINGAASGVTTIVPNVLASGPIQAFQDLVLVNAAGGSTPGAFVLTNGFADQQLLRLGVTFDSPNNDYILTVGPSAAAYRTTMYGEGFRSIWNITADNWTRHHTQLRDETDEASAMPFWMTMTGDNVERDEVRAASVPGPVTTYDVGYEQNYFGFEFGVDLARDQAFNYGLMAGYLTGVQDFSGGLERVSYDTANIGAYASVNSDLLFASILAKYDHVWASATPLVGQPEIDLSGHVMGLRAEAGLKLGDAAGFFAEPSASLSYTDGSIDGFQTVQGAFDFALDEGLLGKIGGRIGSRIGSGRGSIYFGGNYVREFAGEDLVTFTSGTRSFALLGNDGSDYAEGRVGINFGSSDGTLSVTVEGRYADGGDREGFGGSGMVKFRF